MGYDRFLNDSWHDCSVSLLFGRISETLVFGCIGNKLVEVALLFLILGGSKSNFVSGQPVASASDSSN